MTDWHVDDIALRQWIDCADSLPQSASVEQHMLRCRACRDRVSAAVGAGSVPDLSAVWTGVREVVEVPRPSVLERLLRRGGLPAADARLVAAAPAFRGAWLIGALLMLLFLATANAEGHAGGLWLFLAAAPLIPCVSVAVSYDPRFEPALEQEVATPYSVTRLVLLRTIAVLAIVLPVAVVLGVVLPGPAPYLWLLPAIGFVGGVLALSTWLAPLTAAAGIGVAWLAAVGAATVYGSSTDVVHGPFPVVYVAVIAASAVVVLARGRHLRALRPRRSRL
jgi:hypothetical protein